MSEVSRRWVLGAGAGLAAFAATPTAIAQEMSREERQRVDWAYLGKYREANATLLAAGTDVDLVFMGDSITEGWVTRAPGFFTPGRVGRGISGQTTPQMVVRFRFDVLPLAPDIVHIMAGTNDVAGNTGPMSPEMTLANIRSMTELAQANGIRVILASIPPAAAFPWRSEVQPVAPIRATNALIEAYARDARCVYADYFTAMADEAGAMRPGLAYDGVHPDVAGYEAMAPIAEAAIAAARRLRRRRLR